MKFYDELRKTMVALAQIEGDAEVLSILVRAGKHHYCIKMDALAQIEGVAEVLSILVRAGKHYYCINAECEVEELDVDKTKGE